jgi:drug/metabolite transporter (DMT)-like permease
MAKYKISILQAITVNYLVASVFGFLSEPGTYSLLALPNKAWFSMAMIVGITLIVGFNLFALSAAKAGVVITAIASRMSVLIPVLAGILIFSEPMGWMKIAGIILAFFAFFLTFLRKDKVRSELKFIILHFLMFVVMGTNDTLMKFAEVFSIGRDFILFLSTAFLSSLVLGTLVLIAKSKNEKFAIKNVLAGIVLGLLNWYSTFYFLRGLDLFDVSVVVPVINVGIVALSSIAGYFFFKEKLSTINWVGIFIAMLAIFLMAFSIH